MKTLFFLLLPFFSGAQTLLFAPKDSFYLHEGELVISNYAFKETGYYDFKSGKNCMCMQKSIHMVCDSLPTNPRVLTVKPGDYFQSYWFSNDREAFFKKL